MSSIATPIHQLPMADTIESLAHAIARMNGATPRPSDHPAVEAHLADGPVTSQRIMQSLGFKTAQAMLVSTELNSLIDVLVRRVGLDSEAYDLNHRALAALVQVPDFRPASVVRVGLGDRLQPRPEGAQLTTVNWVGRGEPIQLKSYAGGFEISRAAVRNSEWDLLTNGVRELVAAGYATERQLIVDLLTSNPILQDGVEWFHQSRGNIIGEAVLSVTSLGDAMTALRQLEGEAGRAMNLAAHTLVVPGPLEIHARILLEAAQVHTQIKLIADADVTGAAILMPNPRHHPVMALAHLQGETAPRVSSRWGGAMADVWQVKCLLDLAVSIVSPRAVRMPLPA